MLRRGVALDSKTSTFIGYIPFGSKHPLPDGSRLLAKFDLLYNSVGDAIRSMIQSFAAGDFESLNNAIEFQEFNRLAITLFRQTSSRRSDQDFERYREVFTSILLGLQQAMLQYQTLANTAAKLEICEERSSILDDMDKLRDFVNELSTQFNLFPEATVAAPTATFAPQYVEYFALYGVPESGIFDPDKMAEILIRLGINLDA